MTPTDVLNRSRSASTGALNGIGVGILPRGPKSWPSTLPAVGMSLVSAKKKSCLLMTFLDSRLFLPNCTNSASFITLSAFAFFALMPKSPVAIMHTDADLFIFLGS